MDWNDTDVVTNDEIVFTNGVGLIPEQTTHLETQDDMDPELYLALQQSEQIEVFEDHPSGTEIGINVSWFSGSAANDLVPFINQLKGARPFDDPSNSGQITYDENGYPTSVPSHYVVSSLLIRSVDVEGIPPHTGEFRLYGQGSGLISLKGSAQGVLYERADTDSFDREVIDGESYWYVDLNFSTMGEDLAQLIMLIHDIDQSDHIRDLALVHETHLDLHREGEVFTPEIVNDLKGYETLRLMNWMRANQIQEDGNGWGEEGSNWTSPQPEQRYIGNDYYTFNNNAGGKKNEGRFEVSVPVEYLVQLANEVGADPWIAVPVDITDSRAAQLADYVSLNLDDGLTARWEYGNEIFNDAIGFESYRYSLAMAGKTFENFNEVGAGAVAEWAAYRGTQVYSIIKDVFEEDGNEARFVAPGWAFSGSLKTTGSLVENSYLVRYFAAEESRKMDDGTPLPLEVVTDYSVAMYYGGTLAGRHPDSSVVYHIMETVEGVETQADMLAKWLMFGAYAEHYKQLTSDHLGAPMTGVAWSEKLDIGVTPLIWEDIQAGLDPLTELDQILRLEDNVLQYRGVKAQDWTDVIVFDSTPGKTLAEMINDVDLVGYGGKMKGVIHSGIYSSLVNSATMRLDAHAGYAKALGLNFTAYEGGGHVSYPVEGAFDMYDAYNNSVSGAQVFARWLEIMSESGLDEYVHFMSHDRTNRNDWWGVQDYVGQDISSEPEAIVLRKAIEAYDPNHQTTASGALATAESVRTTATGGLVVDLPVVWDGNDVWHINSDGSATENSGSIKQLLLKDLLPVAGGSAYNLSFDVGLEDVDETEIRVVARAMGGGSADLLTWRGMVSDGEALEFNLGTIPEELSSLYVVVQRVGQDRSGSLTIENADVEEVRADDRGQVDVPTEEGVICTLADDCWQPGAGWAISDAGIATSVSDTSGKLSLSELLPVVAGSKYQVSFKVSLDGADSTQLRLVGRAMGGGADEVLRWRGDVTDGQVVTLDMSEIPSDRRLLDVVLMRGGQAAGSLTISDFKINLSASGDTGPDPEPPIGDDGMTGTEGVALTSAVWNGGDKWVMSDDGRASVAEGQQDFLSLKAPIQVTPQGRYEVSFKVSLDGADSTQLRLVGRAMGGGADEVLRWRSDVTDGQVVTLNLNEIPSDRSLLDLVVSRGGAMKGQLTLSDFAVKPVVDKVLA
jgi:hypothetical protein